MGLIGDWGKKGFGVVKVRGKRVVGKMGSMWVGLGWGVGREGENFSIDFFRFLFCFFKF